MLAWNELLTDLAWHEILHRHFRPSQSRKWITAKWLTQGKQLQEVAVWRKLESPLFATHFNIFEFRSKPSLLSVIRMEQINNNLFNCAKILFSHTRKWFFLNYFFIFRLFFTLSFCYFTLSLIFTKIILLLLLIYIYIYIFFMKIIFIFSCSGMFRDPGFIDARLYHCTKMRQRY